MVLLHGAQSQEAHRARDRPIARPVSQHRVITEQAYDAIGLPIRVNFLDAFLHHRKSGKNEKVDSGDGSVEDVIDDVHLVDPLFVNARIPKKLHHHHELSQLRYLRH
eukprot:CAMPEP_0185607490 /NCGR_PEP_ID=MMETSP0436-20130131/5544_1 /TAXON_ID=626734 ORGANISM="Favella taraikaensis, Strain Fe Narragansett Bay" /NCGR_SAMPLE_ID=MMETSP0436 /ASSEMBLY_ACC=CAM_ASM_000390 /LENGTH=106 /DNA_ID=CAMNT_0028239429 /DNA_START=776 /DNA_END=1096 /DNA_ORIENTATION=+